LKFTETQEGANFIVMERIKLKLKPMTPRNRGGFCTLAEQLRQGTSEAF